MKKHTLIIAIAVIYVFNFGFIKTTSVLHAGDMRFNTQYFSTIPPDSLSITSDQSNALFPAIAIREEIYLLGCQNVGFSGYFGIENWELKNTGDDGVDVTGAPNGLLINTIGRSPSKENPRDEWQCNIVIPSEGYVYLDLEKIGGSIFSMEYSINGNPSIPLYKSDEIINSKFTNLLHRNDVLEIRLSFDPCKNNTFLLKDFHFFTNSEKIRKKTSLYYTFHAGIPVFQCKQTFASDPILGFEEVVLPEDISINDRNSSPKYTGYPLIDLDGFIESKDDQFQLDNRVAPFHVSWQDEVVTINHTETILRTWIIEDQCKGNILTSTQHIRLKNSQAVKASADPTTKAYSTRQ